MNDGSTNEAIHETVLDYAEEVFDLLDWSLTSEQIKERTEQIKTNLLEYVKKVEAIPEEERTFENTVWEPSLREAEYSDKFSSISFPSSVSTDSEIRQISTQMRQEMSSFFIELGMREDSYKALKEYANKEEELDEVSQRLLDRELRDYHRRGLGLPKDKRDQLQEIRKELSQIAIQFRQNLNENNDYLLFDKEQLEGTPKSIINSLPEQEGKLRVDLTRPNWQAILENCKIPDTRKQMDIAWDSRCKEENTPLLERAVELRQQAADLLDFDNHAAFALDIKMAKDPQTVNDFQQNLIERLQPFAKDQFSKLVELKNEELGDESDGIIHHYDWRYYTQMYKEKTFDIDMEKVQEYFPTDYVVNTMLEFYQDIFGFTFHKLEDAPVWHEDVICYSITDTETNEFKGIFYLDLYPRSGKYGHAAAFPLIQGRKLPDGSYHPTASAMVANFNKPTEEEPAMLSLDQTRTLFHEFGHIIHQTTTQAKYVRFSGSRVARDFVEAPSQMLENWVLEREVLERISKHIRTGETLPEDIRQRLEKAKKEMQALHWLRQLFFGTFDMACHTTGNIDAEELWFSNYQDILQMEPPTGSLGAASFAHIISGYDAGYYGYLWSRVMAQDLYTRFEKEGPTSKEVGMDYRTHILEPGSEIDEMKLVENFLGRETNNKAFLRHIGLE